MCHGTSLLLCLHEQLRSEYLEERDDRFKDMGVGHASDKFSKTQGDPRGVRGPTNYQLTGEAQQGVRGQQRPNIRQEV